MSNSMISLLEKNRIDLIKNGQYFTMSTTIIIDLAR